MLRVNWLGQEANPWSLSSAKVKNVLYLHTPLNPHCMVVNEIWRQFCLIWIVFTLLSCVAPRKNCRVNNKRWITISNNVLVHRQQWQNAIPVDDESPCGHCVCTDDLWSSGVSVTSDWGRWGKIAALSNVAQCSLVDRHHYRWAYCLNLLPWWKRRFLWNIDAVLPDCTASHTRRQWCWLQHHISQDTGSLSLYWHIFHKGL